MRQIREGDVVKIISKKKMEEYLAGVDRDIDGRGFRLPDNLLVLDQMVDLAGRLGVVVEVLESLDRFQIKMDGVSRNYYWKRDMFQLTRIKREELGI